jgi:hypothetical protein
LCLAAISLCLEEAAMPGPHEPVEPTSYTDAPPATNHTQDEGDDQ